NLMKSEGSHSGQLCLAIGEKSSLQEVFVRKIDSGNDISRQIRSLFGFHQEVIRATDQAHFSDDLYGHNVLGYQLCGIQQVELKFMFLRLGNNLKTEFPFGELSGIYGFPKIAPMTIGIGPANLYSLVPSNGMDTQNGF